MIFSLSSFMRFRRVEVNTRNQGLYSSKITLPHIQKNHKANPVMRYSKKSFIKPLIYACLMLSATLGVTQTQVAPFLTPAQQFFDNNGNPLAGGKVCFFAAGTTTPQATYSESTGTNLNQNPLILDSAGRGVIYLTSSSYKIVVAASSADNTCSPAIKSQDGVTWNNLASSLSSLTVTGATAIKPATAATGGANQNSPNFCIDGFYFNVTSLTDSWCFSDVLGTGTSPTSTLTLTHSGSSGATGLTLPNIAVSGITTLSTTGNATVGGTLGAKIDDGIPHCGSPAFGTPGVTPFQTIMTACVAALPATGTGTVDARGLTDATNLTMTADWTMNRSNTTFLWGAYTVNQGVNHIFVPAFNVQWIGTSFMSGTPSACNGTCFKYTGSGGAAHTFGDGTTQYFGHRIENVAFDMTGASGAAIALTSTKSYGVSIIGVRGYCPVAANTMTFIQNNGVVPPGSQSMKVEQVAENNCQIGFQNTGQTSPPTCNNVVFTGPNQFSGNSASGSIGVDIECGNDVEVSGIYMNGYDHGLKIATPSTSAVRGFFHAESCGTDGISFTAGTAGNWLWTDTGCAITDAVGASSSNTVIGGPASAHTVAFGGSPLQLIQFGNVSDNTLNMNLQAGTSADQQVNINFKDKGNATKYIVQKDTANDLKIQDAAGINRFWVNGNNIFINSAGSAAVNINGQGSSGTGGFVVASGGASPVNEFKIDATGTPTIYRGISTPTVRLIADQTITAGASLVAIPGLSWTMPANTAQNVNFYCTGSYSQATAAASDSFGIQDVTIAPTNIYARKVVWTSTSAALSDNLPTLSTTTATTIGAVFTPSAATTVFNFEIQGQIEQPSNASTSVVQIMAQFTTNNGTIKRGTYCQIF